MRPIKFSVTLRYTRSWAEDQAYRWLARKNNFSCREFPVDHRSKIKKTINKYLDPAGELENLRNLKVTMIPLFSEAF